jgi:hypothetical protein
MYQVTASQTEQNIKLVSFRRVFENIQCDLKIFPATLSYSPLFFVSLQISCVKKHRCLFDHNDQNYKNSVYVDKGWQEVSKEFGENVSDCKKKWR